MGLNFITIKAPQAAIARPAQKIGEGMVLGGCWIMLVMALITGAPPKTSGITHSGLPPLLNAK